MATTTGSEAPAKRSRARRGDGERLREEILEAAEAILIATSDQAAVSIRAVAGRVGVTPPSIYLHFADRADLLYAVADRHFVQLEQAMAQAAEGVDDPRQRLFRRGRAYLHYGLAHPEHYRLLMMARPDATPERLRDERLADTAGLVPVVGDLEAAVAGGAIADRPVLELAAALWMTVHGVVSMLITKPEFPFGDPDAVYERLFDLVWSGLTAGG
ncbi:MAG TPA: TetR/AcrR family transcriptional regulator [Acidimicrobiales bacterium]|nr:TetR/AcrR family transcriptional regulator [Acidimicrobiales bacterium]